MKNQFFFIFSSNLIALQRFLIFSFAYKIIKKSYCRLWQAHSSIPLPVLQIYSQIFAKFCNSGNARLNYKNSFLERIGWLRRVARWQFGSSIRGWLCQTPSPRGSSGGLTKIRLNKSLVTHHYFYYKSRGIFFTNTFIPEIKITITTQDFLTF